MFLSPSWSVNWEENCFYQSYGSPRVLQLCSRQFTSIIKQFRLIRTPKRGRKTYSALERTDRYVSFMLRFVQFRNIVICTRRSLCVILINALSIFISKNPCYHCWQYIMKNMFLIQSFFTFRF